MEIKHQKANGWKTLLWFVIACIPIVNLIWIVEVSALLAGHKLEK